MDHVACGRIVHEGFGSYGQSHGDKGDSYVGREEGDDCSRIAELCWLHCGHWIALPWSDESCSIAYKKGTQDAGQKFHGRDEAKDTYTRSRVCDLHSVVETFRLHSKPLPPVAGRVNEC